MLRRDDTRVGFGIMLLPGAPDVFLPLCRTAEETGFDSIGMADSPSLFRDTFIACALAARATRRITIGPRVINPVTRHPTAAAGAIATVADLAPGRTVLGIGTGDSAVRNAGLAKGTRADLRAYTVALRELLTAGRTTFGGAEALFTWAPVDVPIYIAASGPKTLELAGEVADGVIIQTGLTPEIIADALACIRRGAERAGRDFQAIDKSWFPRVSLADSRPAAIAAIKHSLASDAKFLGLGGTAGKHIPDDMLDKVAVVQERYRFDEHQKPGGANAHLIDELGLTAYLADRFAIAGTPEDCIRKIETAAEAGAGHFWMMLNVADPDNLMRGWSARVMPAFRR